MKQNISMDVEIHGTGYHFETLSLKWGASPTKLDPNDHREDALHFRLKKSLAHRQFQLVNPIEKNFE